LRFSGPPGLMPHPSRMMSITGPAMFPHFADERERGQAVLCCCRILEHLQPSKTAATKEENEVAQPVAGARLSPRLRGSGRHLFSTLGHPKALRHYLIFRRGTG